MSKVYFVLVAFLLISCDILNDEFIIGHWTNNGRYAIENDKRTDQFFAADYLVNYEFFSDNTFKTSLDGSGTWTMENDSMLIMEIYGLKEIFSIKIDTDTSFILTQKAENIDYIYRFVKKK